MPRGGISFPFLIAAVFLTSNLGCGRNTNLKIPNIPKLPSVTLAWDPPEDPVTKVVDPTVTGYRVYWGLKSRDYLATVDVGLVLRARIDYLPRGQVFFAATAYNSVGMESDFSNEVTTRLTLSDPAGLLVSLGPDDRLPRK